MHLCLINVKVDLDIFKLSKLFFPHDEIRVVTHLVSTNQFSFQVLHFDEWSHSSIAQAPWVVPFYLKLSKFRNTCKDYFCV